MVRNVLDAVESRLVISPPVEQILSKVEVDPGLDAWGYPHELEAHRHLVENDLPALIAEVRRLRPLLRRCADEADLPDGLLEEVREAA